MGAPAEKADGGRNAGRLIVPGMDADAPDLQFLLAMGAEDFGHALHYPAVRHHFGAADGTLLAGLENEPHTAGEFLLMGLEILCHGKESCRMGIMPAGMHLSRDLGAEGNVRVFLHGKSVHIRPQGNAFLSLTQICRKAANPVSFFGGDTHGKKLPLHKGSGDRQVEAYLGMPMDGSPNFHGVIKKLG